MHCLYILASSTVALAAVGCASRSVSTEEPRTTPSATPSASETALSPMARWTGNLQPVANRSAYVMGATERTKAYGTVALSSAADATRRTRAQLTFGMPVQVSTEFRWAVLPGRCGANNLPLVGFESFPVIEVGNNGRGQLDAHLPLTIPADGSFHVNVYARGGHQLDNVVACANLRREGS